MSAPYLNLSLISFCFSCALPKLWSCYMYTKLRSQVQRTTRGGREKWWLEELAARNVSAIWLRHFYPHNYENTAFEAYVEMYVLTGEQRYLDAVLGGWEMTMEHFIHVGGAMALNQGSPKPPLAPGTYAPGSYHLNEYGWWPPTGELCGSVFWAKFNQRLHRLFPEEEKYVTEVERSIYNVGVAAQGIDLNGTRGGGIRYFAVMHGTKAAPDGAQATCCQGQGSRLFGGLPEYVYSTRTAENGSVVLYINLFAAASIVVDVNGVAVNVTTNTEFPFGTNVSHTITLVDDPAVGEAEALPFGALTLKLRGPSWAVGNYSANTSSGAVAEVAPGSFSALSAAWTSGDTVSYVLPVGFRLTKYP